MIILPVMSIAQAASWNALLDVHERIGHGWTLIGGQMVHLHCAERGYTPVRPTNDIDAVVDVRADRDALLVFTSTLTELGFRSGGISAEGIQHRWIREDAIIDVLLPDGIGERATSRPGAAGSPTIATPGGTQALLRSESVAVRVEGREGFTRRPDLVGALVMKAAAHTAAGDAAKDRHRFDFATLAALIAARDFRGVVLGKKDIRRLRDMVAATRADTKAMYQLPQAAESLNRLERALRLG